MSAPSDWKEGGWKGKSKVFGLPLCAKPPDPIPSRKRHEEKSEQGNLTSSTGSVANPWRFASGYLDSSTGLYKFGTRYYDPTLGRWPQQDPVRGKLSDPMTLNRYLYVSDDPVNFTDPSGLSGWILAAIIDITRARLLFKASGGWTGGEVCGGFDIGCKTVIHVPQWYLFLGPL